MISESWAIHKFKWPLIVVCVYVLRYLLAWQPNPQENRPINPPHTHTHTHTHTLLCFKCCGGRDSWNQLVNCWFSFHLLTIREIVCCDGDDSERAETKWLHQKTMVSQAYYYDFCFLVSSYLVAFSFYSCLGWMEKKNEQHFLSFSNRERRRSSIVRRHRKPRPFAVCLLSARIITCV